MSKCQVKIQRTGDEVAALLDKIEQLSLATPLVDGLMSSSDKSKLNALGIYYNTTAYWNRQRGYIPKEGELIIYSDYRTVTINGRVKQIPGIKIGTGNGYVQDLMFLTDSQSDALWVHINDRVAHITEADRLFWNNKINVTDSQEVVGEALIFNRN